MSPALSTLVALQQLDTAAEAARRRLAEMPATERELQDRVATSGAAVDAAKARLADNQHARRELEKQVAQVDTRLARFDDHKAAVKTNQEFTALLHEIATAKSEKDAIEEQILLLLEAADGIAAEIKAAEASLAEARRGGDAARKELAVERRKLDEDLARLAHDRAREATAIDPALLAKYDQILKQRRMVAVAPINGELCTVCHVRLRPAVAQNVRRNEDIIQCDSCQRILYYVPKEDQ
jgi:predicted  nucleic acid-binding Zn-ribbon protein